MYEVTFDEPTMLVRTAAKKLDVHHDRLRGLIQSNIIRGGETRGRSGELVWVIPVSEFETLKQKMAEV